ncbi:MAG: hypothetical protein QOF33_4421 [Thermomicrobiales bacterium]|nr:hypothetical protein [Thermomicrobiales bacterium]
MTLPGATADSPPLGQAETAPSARTSASSSRSYDAIIDELVTIANSAGIDLDRESARDWLQAVARANATPGEFARTMDGQFGGHELALIDFDPTAAARLRQIGRLVATPPMPAVSSALAIAGSSAQGRIQPFPADADFFERLHIAASDHESAVITLAHVIHSNVVQSGQQPGLRFEEVYFGHREGLSLCWSAHEFAAGQIERRLPTGKTVTVSWGEAAADPGFIKIDWTLIDPSLGGPGRVSKAIDATWETPDGAIESLDGVIDADFQQIYLDAAAADLAAAITAGLEPGSRDYYIWHMEREIAKYCNAERGDYAKVAKRLYNLCRLTGRFAEAAYVRELFDEPPARLHQIRLRIELGEFLNDAERMALASELLALARAERRWCEEAERDLLCHWAEMLREFDAISTVAPADHPVEAVRRLASTAFERGLRSYAPISSLIDEICRRHTDLPSSARH